MSLEQQLDRLCEALEENTKALRGGKAGAEPTRGRGRPLGAKNKDKDEEDETDDVEDDEEDEDADDADDEDTDDDDGAEKKEEARNLLIKVKKTVGKEEVTALMKLVKAKSFDQIGREDYDKVIRLAKKALAGGK